MGAILVGLVRYALAGTGMVVGFRFGHLAMSLLDKAYKWVKGWFSRHPSSQQEQEEQGDSEPIPDNLYQFPVGSEIQ